MNKLCRFDDCGTYGKMNAVFINGMELAWCTKCGRIQTKIG